MTLIRTLATHEIVQRVFPRPITERDELGMATGKAIDDTLARFSHEYSQNRRPTASAMSRLATETLDEELLDAHLEISVEDRARVLGGISGVIQAFRRSEIFGLPRPKTRLILINEAAGVYAQPDFWNGKDRFYEMKSYRALPPPPDVALQLRMFQLAFPTLACVLICFNRHTIPVETAVATIPPPSKEEVRELLSTATRMVAAHGQEKVLEYVENPVVRYVLQE